MKHIRKTETKHNPILLVTLFATILVFIIGVAIIISACAESYVVPTVSSDIVAPENIVLPTHSSTIDTATKDQEKAVPTEVETSSIVVTESPTEPVEPTQFEDTDEYQAYGEQTYEVDPADYEVVDEYDYETYNYSEDADLLAKVIYLEAGECSEYCQWLVGSTAMNLADEYGSLSAVAYNYNIFNVAYDIDSCQPSELSYSVAERILSGDRDYNVRAFRDGSYHTFGTPYDCVDGVYFSTY